MFKHIPLHSISIDNQEGKYILRNFLFWYWFVILASDKLWLGHICFWNQTFSPDIWFLSSSSAIVTTLRISDLRLIVKWKSLFGQTLIGSDRPLEPQIFVRHMIFIIPKGHSYYPENFRFKAYGLNKSHFLVFWI